MKILIVEDEIKTGEYLSKGLTEAGFVVDHADNGLTGYHLAMTAEYDLVILDIMLPDVNGWDIIRRHCCKVSDEAAFCLIQRPYISKTLLTRRISPRGSP